MKKSLGGVSELFLLPTPFADLVEELDKNGGADDNEQAGLDLGKRYAQEENSEWGRDRPLLLFR